MTKSYVVRYGRMRHLAEFTGLPDRDHARGEAVVVKGDRGLELGEVLCPATLATAGHLPQGPLGEIARTPTPEDRLIQARSAADERAAFTSCRERVEARNLQMDLVDVEIPLGRERIIFYYLAEKRVDFRELVKDLARVLRTRIEMRQIGVRDEAKLLADYGDCGKPVCCNTHLTEMPPVSMKMAKIQKSTLDPGKISGRCGRLKCCLRYEYDVYREAERTLPAVGSRVRTPKGDGRVTAQDVLARKLVVEFEDQRRIIVGSSEVQVLSPGKRGPTQAATTTDGRQDTEDLGTSVQASDGGSGT